MLFASPIVRGSRTKVEEDNEAALAFYGGKGFKKLFVDKAARRYDTSGFLLQNVRTSKLTMRKVNRAGSFSVEKIIPPSHSRRFFFIIIIFFPCSFDACMRAWCA